MSVSNTRENYIRIKNNFSAIRNVSDVDFMEGHNFEFFCAYILEKNGFKEINVTKGSGDQGVDVLASKNEVRYAIQCKNYATPLSNTPVQEVYAGKTHYNCHVGVVMTNSTFTPGAVELANSTGVLMWDRNKLQEMIGVANAGQPIKVVVKKKQVVAQGPAVIQRKGTEEIIQNRPQEKYNHKKQGLLRKSMKTWAIVCFVLASIYVLTSIIMEPFTIAGTACFGILGIMFLLLALTPKESEYLFGLENGLKKKSFVIGSVCLAFFSFGIIASLLQ